MSRGMYCLIRSEHCWPASWYACPVERRDEAEDVLADEYGENVPDWLVPIERLESLQFPAFVIT